MTEGDNAIGVNVFVRKKVNLVPSILLLYAIIRELLLLFYKVNLCFVSKGDKLSSF